MNALTDKTNRSRFFDTIFTALELLALVLWMLAEVVHHRFWILYVVFLSLAAGCFLTGITHLVNKGLKRPALLWAICSLFTLSFALVVFLVSKPDNPEAKPHFVVSLQIGDSPNSKVFLTNEFLSSRDFVKTAELPKGAFLVNSLVKGCLVIPVDEGESNKVFNFTVENDSSVKVSDLQAAVGFPKEWKCGFSPKWHEGDESLIIIGASRAWKFMSTNMQYVVAQSPWVLFPHDSMQFPSITNPCITEYIGSSIKGGIVEFSLRSTGFESVIAANVIFFPASSNFSKPFVTLGKIGSDGKLTLSVTEDEFEKSQK